MRLGKRQIECLEQFAGPEPKRFKPARFERPWPVMIRLSELGLLWIEKRLSGFWDPSRGEWVRQGNGRSMLAGLTQKGEEALASARGPQVKGQSDE